jgi:hypothetical protein
VVKEGRGTIVSDPPGILCGSACSAEFLAGTRVTLDALTENGSESMFMLWTPESGCSTDRRCQLGELNQSREVFAFFRTPFNPTFASSTRVSPTLGGIQEYDRFCNELASRAGINTSAGDVYFAVMSDSSNAFRDRLGDFATTWELTDGSYYATTALDLFDRDVLLRSLDLDEYGAFISDQRERRFLTGTLADGSPSPDNCNDWTDPGLTATAGVAGGGPGSWLMGDTVSCSEPQHVLCTSARFVREMFFPDPGFRTRIWVSKTRFVPGTLTPDEHCRLNLPPDVINAQALVAYTYRAARESLIFGSDVEYARPDGYIVGNADELVSFRTRTGIWQADDLTYLSPFRTGSSPDVWTGQSDFDRLGTVESTCNDWTSTAGAGTTGRYDIHRRAFWGEPDSATGAPTRSVSCADPAGAHLYCLGTVY